jgi:hypothetical protein
MQSPTIVTHRLFFILITVILLSTVLGAQSGVKIHERIEIAPKIKITNKANSSSSELPYFVGSINLGIGSVDPKDYSQSFTVLRPCKIVGTGTFTSGEPIPVTILVDVGGGGATNYIDIANRTDSINGLCGMGVYCYLWNGTSCGGFYNVNVSGDISGSLITYNMTGDWNCQAAHVVPFTASVTLQAIPINSGEPSTIAMNASRTSFDAYGSDYLATDMYPTVCDDSGTPISYCGPSSMVATIENPIDGTYFVDDLLKTSLGTSRTIVNGGRVLFYWDGSDLPNGMDSVILSIRAECMGVSGTQKIQLKKIVPHHFTVTPNASTIYAGESDTIRAIAKNSNDEEVALDGGKSITFFDGSGTGSFIVGSDIIQNQATISYDQAKNGSIKYYRKLDLSNLVDEKYVQINVFRTEFPERNGWCWIHVMPACPVVSLSEKIISPGNKTTVNVMAQTVEGNFPYPSDQKFIASMDADARYGRLRCISTGDEGSYVYGQQPFEFIAADSIDVDSIVVEIGAYIGGGGAASIGVGKDTLRSGSIMANVQVKAINIEDVSNGTKRKNIELSMNSLQARLNKVSVRKGNEKQQ